MKTINTLMDRLTDTRELLRELGDTLRTLDPDFPEEEKKYLRTAEVLEREPGGRAYLTAMEQRFCSDMIYAGWLGFRLSLDCFEQPVNKLLLDGDFEDLHREGRMHTLPMAQTAQRTIDAFSGTLSPDKRCLTEEITGYYTYLQTTGYKLAHYFGFRLGDRFLYFVIPGYVSDSVTADRYTRRLGDFLNLDLWAVVGE